MSNSDFPSKFRHSGFSGQVKPWAQPAISRANHDSPRDHANDDNCVFYTELGDQFPLADEGKFGDLRDLRDGRPGFSETLSAAMAEAMFDILKLPAPANGAHDPRREAAADMLTTIARYAASESEYEVADRLRRYARLARNFTE